MKYLIDTSAWIEYLEGSLIGDEVNKFMGSNEIDIYTMPLILSEVVSKVKRKKGNIDSAYRIITTNAEIIDTDMKTAKEAGLLHAEMKSKIEQFSLADAIIVKTAQSIGAKIVTKDNHFAQFKETLILK